MIQIAIASENGTFDSELYRYLVERVLETKASIWRSASPIRFSGCRSVVNQAPSFLRLAEQAQIRHALLGIDNDGGSRRGPEHEPDHDVQQQAADEDGCRVCRLMNAIPSRWKEGAFRHCVVVPVQAMETWLLAVKGHDFNAPTPEQYFNRSAMKKQFFGRKGLPVSVRTQMALAELQRPESLEILRQRKSFQHFEQQLAAWG